MSPRLKRLFLRLAFVIALVAAPPIGGVATAGAATSSPAPLHLYQTEYAAQAHCPADTVVWLNNENRIYHLKGERWFGNTKQAAYVCKKEADAAGDRETRNGQ